MNPHTSEPIPWARLLTEPMTITEIAGHFGLSRQKARVMLKHMAGVENVAGKFRVPALKMPVAYLVSVGVISPQVVTDGNG